jgi:hypothetical protein
VARELADAEKLTGTPRSAALTRLASQLDVEAPAAKDSPKVRMMAEAIRKLANAQP